MGNKQRAKAGWAEVAAWICVLLLWASAASAYIDPRFFGFAAVMGLAFPVFLGLVGLITVVLLFFARQKIWIPLVGLVVCFGAVRRYCPFNFKSTPPKTAIKVISYNTLFLGGPCEDPTTGENNVALYLELQKADIACLQEVPSFDGYYEQHVFPVMKHAKYHDGILFNGVFIAMFSHYPIVRHELVCQDEGNGSVAFWTVRGFGRSFNRDAIFVRIDQMFCSEEFTPYAAYVDSRIKCSDHYPIVAYFEPTKK